MTSWPTNLRALNICHTPDGQYQASLQTDSHLANAFSIAVADTIEAAVAELVARRAPPPPY